ncbi:unnamed protein product [Closterium sp. NIES-54]
MGPKLLLVSLVVLLLSGGALAVKRISTTSTIAPTNADVQTLKQKSLAMQQQASQRTQERINAELAADEAQKADDVANAAVIAAKKDVDNAVTAKNIASTNVGNADKSVAKVKPARDAAQKSIDDKQAALDKAKTTLAAETKKGASLTGAAKTKQDGVIKSAQTAYRGMLSRLLRTPFSADGDNGQGFLDGKSADYETSGVLSTDCGYSAFSKAM